jgi:hypothetical protein
MSRNPPKIDQTIASLSPASILVPEKFEDLKYAGYYFIEIADHAAAAELSLQLESILGKAQIATAHDQYLLGWVMFWMLRLRLFGFSALTLGQQTDVFKKYAVQIAFYELDPVAAAISYFDLFSGPKQADEATKSYINALLSDTGVIGSKLEEFQKRNFKPTVAGWVSEYQATLSQRKVNVLPAAFDIVKFLDTNPNVRGLSAGEREQLRAILTFYNWLLGPIVYQEPAAPPPAATAPPVGAPIVPGRPLNVQDVLVNRRGGTTGGLQRPNAPQSPSAPVQSAPPPVPIPRPAAAPKPVVLPMPPDDISAELEKLRQRKINQKP